MVGYLFHSILAPTHAMPMHSPNFLDSQTTAVGR